MPSCTPGGNTTLHFGFCLPADGEINWGTAYRSTMTAIDEELFNVGIPRSYLAGMQTTPTQASTSVSIAEGVAMGNDQATQIRLTSPLVKVLSSSWAVGTGNGGLYAATTIQGNQSYHIFTILRTDTSVVDAYYDTDPAAANIPSPYTIYRRIASFKTDGNSNIRSWIQDGDKFQAATAVLDIGATIAALTANTATLGSVPTGVNFQAIVNIGISGTPANRVVVYISDLATQDMAASETAAPLGCVFQTGGIVGNQVGPVQVRTNTSAQIRWRAAVNANGTFNLATLGWVDSRGRND